MMWLKREAEESFEAWEGGLNQLLMALKERDGVRSHRIGVASKSWEGPLATISKETGSKCTPTAWNWIQPKTWKTCRVDSPPPGAQSAGTLTWALGNPEQPEPPSDPQNRMIIDQCCFKRVLDLSCFKWVVTCYGWKKKKDACKAQNASGYLSIQGYPNLTL